MPENVLIKGPDGEGMVRSSEAADTLRKVFGAQQVSSEGLHADEAASREDARLRAEQGGVLNKVLTLAEGMADAASLGLAREHGKRADLRRDESAGTAFIGQALGTLGGLVGGGPVSWLAEGGERAGKMFAKEALRRSEKSIVTRAMAEGGANAALAAATATNHALMDTVLADKPFAAESILDESALAGVLGVAAGGIIGSLSRLKGASRASVAGQDKFLGNIDDALTHVDEFHGAYSDALRKHEATYGAIKELRKQGKLSELSDDFMFVRKEALRKARIAERGMKSVDIKDALTGKDPAAYKRFQAWRTKYTESMEVLDDVMNPASVERIAADAAGPQATPTKVTIDRGGSFAEEPAPSPEYLDAEVALADAKDALATADVAKTPDVEAALKADVEAATARVKGAKETAKSTLKSSDQAGKYVDNPEGQEAAIERMFKKPGTKAEKAKAAEEWLRGKKTEPEMFHGSAKSIEDLTEMGSGSNQNVYGDGFYTTDDLEIAKSYKSKGAKAAGPEAEAKVYKVSETGKVKMYDLDAPMSESTRKHLTALADTSEAAAYALEKKTLGEAMDEMRSVSREVGESRDTLQANFENLKEALKAEGYGGFTHKGGKLTGGKGHQVKIFWEPKSQVSIAPHEAADMPSPPAGKVIDVDAGQFVTPEVAERAAPVDRGDLDALNAAVAKLPVRTSAENGAAMGQFLDQAPLEAGPKEALLRQMMDDWFQQPTGTARPTAQAAAAAQESFERLYAKTGGRMDSARATNVLESDGILPSSDTHGAHFDGIYSMNRAAKLAADESRGVATSLGSSLRAAMTISLGAGTLGPASLLLPAALKKFAPGLVGKLAGAASTLAIRTAEAVSKFVTSTSTRTVIQAANNTAWTYSDKGPIKDPVERIQEIQFLAANPEAIRERVREGAGELRAMSPDLVSELEERTIQQITGLAMTAPAILYDKLGRAIAPPQGKLRQFFEYENVTNNLDIYLKALASGSLTRPQIMAGKVCWPQVNMKVAAAFIADPDLLQKLERHKLSVIESVTGLPLTNANDPQFIIRQQHAWLAQQQQQAAQAPQKPQAFNINPSGAPTPAQASGKAPGN